MKLAIHRRPSVGGATIGKLYIDGVYACCTLEDEIREIEGQPVADWKIKGATAIPAGVYRVTLEHSNRFGADTLTLHDVPGFTSIRMHAGNFAGLETFLKSKKINRSLKSLATEEYLEVVE